MIVTVAKPTPKARTKTVPFSTDAVALAPPTSGASMSKDKRDCGNAATATASNAPVASNVRSVDKLANDTDGG